MLLLLDEDAGYYFQSKPGEEICGILNDALVQLWRARLGKSFDDAALTLSGRETAQEAERLLQTTPVNLTSMATTLFTPSSDYPDPLSFTTKVLKLFGTVLAFESASGNRNFRRIARSSEVHHQTPLLFRGGAGHDYTAWLI
jgi:hypothetical protein